MLYVLNQNFNKNYLFVPKTRRYKTYIKNIFTPFMFILTLELLLTKSYFNIIFYLKRLSLFYHFNFIWYFYNNNIFWKKASLTNNINYSYDYWLLKNQISLFSCSNFSSNYHKKGQLNFYVKTIKIFNFYFKNKKLSLLFILLFINIFNLSLNYKNLMSLTLPHLLVPNTLNFFTFINYYYFRIYNY